MCRLLPYCAAAAREAGPHRPVSTPSIRCSELCLERLTPGKKLRLKGSPRSEGTSRHSYVNYCRPYRTGGLQMSSTRCFRVSGPENGRRCRGGTCAAEPVNNNESSWALAHPRNMKMGYHAPAAARATSRCLGRARRRSPRDGPPFAIEILEITFHRKNPNLWGLGITLAAFTGCRGWPRSVARSRQGRNASRQYHCLRVRHGWRPDRLRPDVGPRQVGWRGDRG